MFAARGRINGRQKMFCSPAPTPPRPCAPRRGGRCPLGATRRAIASSIWPTTAGVRRDVRTVTQPLAENGWHTALSGCSLRPRTPPGSGSTSWNPVDLALDSIGVVTLRTSSIVVSDSNTENRDSGASILIDETSNDTVGAGTIVEPREVGSGEQTRNDIRWHPAALERDYRKSATGQRGATI